MITEVLEFTPSLVLLMSEGSLICNTLFWFGWTKPEEKDFACLPLPPDSFQFIVP